MDSITHLTQKLLAERARARTQAPPPPYSTAVSDDADADSSDDEAEDEDSKPISLTINAGSSIQGCNNLVPVSSSPLADATKFSALLLHAITRINAESQAAAPGRKQLKVDLTINCSLTIVGDRNVVGNVGVRPRQGGVSAGAGPGVASQTVVAGAKRKAESGGEEEEEAEQPAAKVVKMEA